MTIKCSNTGCDKEVCCVECDKETLTCTCETASELNRNTCRILKECPYATKRGEE